MTEYRFVPELPDLIQPEEYASDPEGRRLRVRLRADGDGLELLGDAANPEYLEQLLAVLGADVVEQMLCG